MLYKEFLAGTKARDTKETYQQYEVLENIYRDCEDVTKNDIYRIWRQTYGKQQQLDREHRLADIQKWSEYRDPSTGEASTPDQVHTYKTLYQIGVSVVSLDEFKLGKDAEITTPDGLTYRMETYDVINGHRQARLLIKYEDKTYGTALIYSFGQLRFHATPENLPKIVFEESQKGGETA